LTRDKDAHDGRNMFISIALRQRAAMAEPKDQKQRRDDKAPKRWEPLQFILILPGSKRARSRRQGTIIINYRAVIR
jgi:hypothetical protein